MKRFKSITRLTLLVACGLILLVVCGLIIWQPWTYLHEQHISQGVGATPADLVPTDKQPTITSSPNAPPRPTQDDTVLKESSDPLLDKLLESTITEVMSQGRREISGTIFEPISHTWWDDFFTKLETAGSGDEFMQILMNMENLPEHPAAGTVVTVQSGSFSAQTTTDAEGRFRFIYLPPDSYTLSYSDLSRSRTGQERATIDKRNVQFNRHGGAYLALRSDGITVKGRIIDASGQPIAGAKVIGTKRIREIDGPRVCPVPSTAISRADGTYELQGVDPPKALFFDVSAYLVGSAPTTDFLLDVHVEADGFEENNVHVPLVTEELLYQGRRFLKAHSKLGRRFGHEETKEKEQLPYPLPASYGNTIMGIDIALERTGTNVQVEEEGLADNSEVTEQALQGGYEISGTVYEPVPQTWWDDFFTKLETVESYDEFEQMDESMMEDMLRPAAGTVVTVQSASFSAQTTTDAKGRFRFINLPRGSYTLSYSYLSRSRTGQERAIIDKRNVQFNRRGGADFGLRSDGITVRGRIIDAYGQPIAGAKVIGTKPSWHRIREIDSAEVTCPVPFTAISRADGTYELQGIDPPNRQFVDVSCYLLEGIVPDTGFILVINVEADGFADNDVLQVPLVTEGLLYRGRRFLKTYSKFSQGSALEEPKEKEQLPYPLPTSYGNVITVPDIVID